MSKYLAAIALILSCYKIAAAPPYTAEQLNRMVAAGDHPLEGYMLGWEKRRIPADIYGKYTEKPVLPFEACKLAAERELSLFRKQFPVATIIDDKKLHVAKAWTTDGITKTTCYHSDFSLFVSRFEYRK